MLLSILNKLTNVNTLYLYIYSSVTDELFVDQSTPGVNTRCSPGIYDQFIIE